MGANSAGIYGAQLYRKLYLPKIPSRCLPHHMRALRDPVSPHLREKYQSSTRFPRDKLYSQPTSANSRLLHKSGSDDEPRYRRAFSICIAVLSLGTILAVIRKVDEIVTSRREKDGTHADNTGYEQVKGPNTGAANERRISISDSVADALPQPNRIAADVKPVVA